MFGALWLVACTSTDEPPPAGDTSTGSSTATTAHSGTSADSGTGIGPGTGTGALEDSSTGSGTSVDPDSGTDSGSGSETDSGSGMPPVLPSPGCGRARAPTGSISGQTTNVGGTDRSYDLFVPEPYDTEHPHSVIFSYHGAGGTANTNQFRLDNFSEADGGTSINVAPQGWSHPMWPQEHFVPFSFDDSVVVFDQVLDQLAQNYCIDLNRVFVIGNSNGGQMAFHLGCVRGDRIRAIVPNGGRCFAYGLGLCDPYHGAGAQSCEGEVMVLSVMGEDDVTRHAEEEATVDGYRLRHGCDEMTESREPEPCVRYTGCTDGGEIAYCRIPDLRHGLWSDGRRAMYDYMMSL